MRKLQNLCFCFDMCRLAKVEQDLDEEIWRIFDLAGNLSYFWMIPGEFEESW